jgi:hypothetical protein
MARKNIGTGADELVLCEREPKDALIAKHLAELFVTHFCQGRKHHDDEPDSDRNVGCPCLKAIDEARRGRNEMPDSNADRHCQNLQR